MRNKLLLIIALIFSVNAFAQEKPKDAYPFENEIKAFKQKDSISMPQPGGMLFIGSSSIRKWVNLPKHFPDKPIIMRGVGGSKLSGWVKYYMPSVVYPYRPARIFIYAGDNDVAAGASGQTVYQDFVQFLGMVQSNLPNATVYFLSLKLSPSRAKYYSEVALANKLISDYLKDKPKAYYIDVNTTLLKDNALPDSALFQKDMLHLNPDGYSRWEKIIENYLK